ncbi:MAG: hypothetical protein HY021_14305 [Burkholderiales bacterium]|nr:hypothetical protein [Burkholderiales bacterium]
MHRHALRARHFFQRAGQGVGLVEQQRKTLPLIGPAAQHRHRLRATAGGDRQQGEDGGFVRIPGQLDRAHRGAAGCGGQDTAAGVGEEQRIDQLGLAARELGHEGQHQAIRGQPLAQRGHQRRRGVVQHVLPGQALRQLLDAAVECAPPVGQRIELARQLGCHRTIVAYRASPRPARNNC